MRNFVRVTLYIKDLTVQTTQQVQAYSALDLLSDIGTWLATRLFWNFRQQTRRLNITIPMTHPNLFWHKLLNWIHNRMTTGWKYKEDLLLPIYWKQWKTAKPPNLLSAWGQQPNLSDEKECPKENAFLTTKSLNSSVFVLQEASWACG